MASVENPCYLVTHGAARSSAYLCIPVDAALAARSPVLTSLMESSGMKELPEGVSPDSFQSWCTACPSDASKQEPEELAMALQVRCLPVSGRD